MPSKGQRYLRQNFLPTANFYYLSPFLIRGGAQDKTKEQTTLNSGPSECVLLRMVGMFQEKNDLEVKRLVYFFQTYSYPGNATHIEKKIKQNKTSRTATFRALHTRLVHPVFLRLHPAITHPYPSGAQGLQSPSMRASLTYPHPSSAETVPGGPTSGTNHNTVLATRDRVHKRLRFSRSSAG